MSYSLAQACELHRNLHTVLEDLQDLILKTMIEGQAFEHASPVREYLLHGAARRLKTVRWTVQHIFELFPPDQVRPLESDPLSDVQANLHAFVMNLYGLYDNWAWAFVLRHNLLQTLGDKRRIGLFQPATQKYLPAELSQHLTSDTLKRWHDDYAKSFRDALAHRIPPYVPPFELTEEEGRRYKELEEEQFECIKNMRLERLEEILAEQATLGRPSFMFLQAFSEGEASRPMLLHPQLIADSRTAIEFGKLFLQHWHKAVAA